jgi:hypothetical protein
VSNPPPASSPPLTVKLVSGEELIVLTPGEQRWFNNNRQRYLEQTRFTETTDLQDLDRLMAMELQVFRMTMWSSAGHDYDEMPIDEALIRRNIREYSEQINKTKTAMGLTKAARDEARNSGDLAEYFSDLKMRAKIFGIHREEQLTKALSLVQELSAIVGSFDRSDKEERAKLGFESEAEILEWVRNTMLPEFAAIDQHFRENEQRYWVRKQ